MHCWKLLFETAAFGKFKGEVKFCDQITSFCDTERKTIMHNNPAPWEAALKTELQCLRAEHATTHNGRRCSTRGMDSPECIALMARAHLKCLPHDRVQALVGAQPG